MNRGTGVLSTQIPANVLLNLTFAMSNSIIIRAATIVDSSAYESFLSALFAENLDTLCPRTQGPTSEQVHSWMASHTGENSVVFLALRNDQLLGTINITRFSRPHMALSGMTPKQRLVMAA